MLYIARCGYATFVRNWKVVLRAYPWSFFVGGILLGILTAALSYFMYHLLANGQVGAEFSSYTGTSDYMSYIILGTGLYTFSISIMLGISRSMITEGREGTLESLLLTPGRRLAYFLGITLQWATTSLAETLLLLLVMLPFGLHFDHINGATFLLALPVALIGLLGMSIMLGACMLALRDTYVSQNTLFVAMTLLCGFIFPVNYLPLPLQWLGAALPVTGAMRLLRAGLLNGLTPAQVITDVVLYSLLGLAYIVAGLWCMRLAERRALERAG